MTEKQIMDSIRAELSRNDVRLFRNNVGLGFTANGLPINFGLQKGSGDLLGWVRVIKNEQVFAVFLSVEVKTPRGKLSQEQINWMDSVNKVGGIAIVATSPEEAREKLNEKLLTYE